MSRRFSQRDYQAARGRQFFPRRTANNAGVAYDYTVTITASRTTGIAPAVIFFTVTGSTGHNGSLIHDVNSYWTFTGGTNVNKRGHFPSQTYATAGTYLVEVVQVDGDGRVGYGSLSITISDWSGTTYYVDSASTDGGTGTTTATSGADRAFATIGAAVTAIGSSANYRILLNNGNTFTYTSTFSIPAATAGNVIRIGSYGTGARPKWKHLNDTTLLSIGGDHKDFFCYGIDFQGNFNTTDGGHSWTTSMSAGLGGCIFLNGPGNTVGFEHFGFYDCIMDGFAEGFLLGSGDSSTPSNPRQLCIQSCEIRHIYHYAAFLVMGVSASARASICDSILEDTGSETGTDVAQIRFPSFRFMEITNNIARRRYGGSTGHFMQINSVEGYESRYTFIADNFIDYSTGAVPTSVIKFGIEGGQLNQMCRDVVIDGNRYLGMAATQSQHFVASTAKNIALRNNETTYSLNMLQINSETPTDYVSGGTEKASVIGCSGYVADSTTQFGSTYGNIFDQGSSTAPTAIEVSNNCYRWASSAAYGNTSFMDLGASQLSKLTHKNNLGFHTGGSAASANYINEGGTTYKFNSATATDNGAIYDDPDFVSSTDLHLTAGSPAINAGINLGGNTYRDKDGVLRGASVDVGAYEYA